MIVFKNHDGFSIIEIVVTIAIIGTTLMALFGSQSASIRSVTRGHQAVIRLYTIKNQIIKQGMQPSSDEPAKTIEGQITKPKTTLKYKVKNIPFESALAPLKNLYLVQVSGSWRTLGKEFKELFVNLLFVPKKQKK